MEIATQKSRKEAAKAELFWGVCSAAPNPGFQSKETFLSSQSTQTVQCYHPPRNAWMSDEMEIGP